MKTTNSIDVALHCGKAAMAMMERHKVPPIPDNFSVWYAYVGGHNPQLIAEIDNLLKAGRKFDDKLNEELYERFASTSSVKAELREAGQRVEEAVGRVLQYLNQANDGTANYGVALETFSGHLAGDQTPDHLSEAVAAILDETKVVSEINQQLERQLETSSEEITRLRNDLADLKREATTDALTELSNRKHFDQTLEEAILKAKSKSRALCLLILDIDHFKQFNDNFGHQMGDQILKLVARILGSVARSIDTTARYGGEEFAVILPEMALDEATQVAEAIRTKVADRKVTNRRTGQVLGQVTLSIGVAEYQSGESMGGFVHRADEAMYTAKRQGRNQVKTERDVPS
ncbi:GGDEF domain [Candidatus Terasakiella magnetica]|nr:GGDEF domain [Candidatus Terasakiella magnetica]